MSTPAPEVIKRKRPFLRDRTDWKVYNPLGTFMGATKHPADAAILVSAWGAGSKIKYGHSFTVWTEGKEEFSAAESYDRVGQICYDRVNEYRREQNKKFEKEQAAIKARRTTPESHT